MEENTFTCPAVLVEIKTMSDGGLRLRIETQELSPAEIAKLFSCKNKYGILTFRPD